MSKRKILITFSKLSEAELQLKADFIIKNLTNNPYFATPTPSLAEVEAALDDFNVALLKAKEGAKVDIAIKNNKKTILLNLLKDLALYVQLEGKGDEAALISSGFTLQKLPQPVGILAKPKNFKVMNLHPGITKLSLSSIYGSRMYLYEYRALNSTTWESTTDTKTTVLLNNLTKGTEYEFRVAGMGASPDRVYSDTVTGFAL